jgi:signal transduction histidine kinase
VINIRGTTVKKNAGHSEAPPSFRDNARLKKSMQKLDEAKNQAELYIDLLYHDINNMNQVAMGYLEIAIEKVKQGKYDPALLAKPMEMLKDSSKLLENVKKIQKTRSGEQKFEALDLGPVLEGVISQYSSVPGREVMIQYEPVEGRAVYASELLKDVFSNLIGNSIKHSSGRVTINVVLAEVVKNGENYYRVDVVDDGPGIPDDIKPRVFDRFARGSTKARGKGLGLYLVKALVDSFQGCVWVEDRVPGEYGKGSKFVVMLPAAKKYPGAMEADARWTDNNVYMP